MNKPKIFLLHFAGGNIYSFQFLIPFLRSFDVVPLELPGRGKRLNEELLKDADLAIADLIHQIVTKLNGEQFLIYGHSMGAILGLLLTKKLEEKQIFPKYLIVSGNAGPGTKDRTEKRYLLPFDEFKLELKLLGGVPEELFLNRELYEYFEPILRADFEIIEKQELEISSPILTSLYALMGVNEICAESIDNWRKYSSGEFNCEVLEGDHFFIYKHAEYLAKIISDCYDKSVV